MKDNIQEELTGTGWEDEDWINLERIICGGLL
jgi:hypothetical protein